MFAFLVFAAPIMLNPAETQQLLLRCGIGAGRLRRRRGAGAAGHAPPPVRGEHRLATGAAHAHRSRTADDPRRARRGRPRVGDRLGRLRRHLRAAERTETLAASLYIFSTVALGGISTSAVLYLIVEWIMRPMSARALEGGPPDLVRADHSAPPGDRVDAGDRRATARRRDPGDRLLCGIGFEPQRTFAAILVLVMVALVVGLFTILIAVRSVSDRVGALRVALRPGSGRRLRRPRRRRRRQRDRPTAGRFQHHGGGSGRTRTHPRRIRHLRRPRCRRPHPAFGRTAGGRRSRSDDHVRRRPRVHLIRRAAAPDRRRRDPQPVVRADRSAGPSARRPRRQVRRRRTDRGVRCAAAPDRSRRSCVGHRPGDRRRRARRVRRRAVGGRRPQLRAGGGRQCRRRGRLEFSVIGDAVNVAARVESATRETGDPVLLSDRTLGMLTNGHGGFVERPGLTLKGKSTPVQIYAPLAVAR